MYTRLLFVSVLFFFSCKTKKTEEGSNPEFFPVLSYLKSQVKRVDTSLNGITKIITENDVSDTTYIQREEFRTYAKDFLSIPDISNKKWKDDYTVAQWYDEGLKSVILNYTPKEKDAEIRRQEVIIQPNAQTGDDIKTIFIDHVVDSDDSTVQKKLTWQVNKQLQVITIIQKENSPDRIQIMQLIWNRFSL